MIQIKFETTNFPSRRTCFFCGGSTEKDGVSAEVHENGQATGLVVCPTYGDGRQGCLGLSVQELAERLMRRAEHLREKAADLTSVATSLADRELDVPTQAEWERAGREYALELQAQWGRNVVKPRP